MFVFLVIASLLAACASPGPGATEPPGPATEAAAPPTQAPAETTAPETTTAATQASPAGTEPAPTQASPEGPPLSYEPVVYNDLMLGFELEHPAEWTVEDPQVLGDRAYQVRFTDQAGLRMNLVIYQWDPQSDLAAYVAHRKMAWEGSGLALESEEMVPLEGGGQGARFILNTLEGEQVLFFFTPVGDRYLELNGTGDLDLLKEITGTVRLLGTEAGPSSGLEPVDCSAGEEDQLSWVACNVIAGLSSRNLSALHGFMSNPFTIGYWRSEGRTASPEEITAELVQSRLPADPSIPLTFTTDRSQFPSLDGQPPDGFFGPDLNVAVILYSEGWGVDGQGAALLYFVQNDAGEYKWHAMAYSDTHFE
jgi:hypothetical protein